MQKNARLFAQKLQKCLDDLNVPTPDRERALVFSKMLNIPKQQAWSILEGHIYPDDSLLEKIAAEVEVDKDWLLNDEEES